MADDEERVKAEKLAAAKKRVAQIQKQKKKANKKTAGADKDGKEAGGESTTKDEAETSAIAEEEEEEGATPTPTPAADDDNKQDVSEKPGAAADSEEKTPPVDREGSPTEPMPEAPTSLPSEVEPQVRIDAPRGSPNHGRQPSLSIQSKIRSSSFRKSSVSQGSVSPSPSATMRSPSLPPLTADGDSVHEVYRKQSTKIEDLEKDNKRLEKELEEASGRWRKTEEQLEDLRESSVDSVELKDKLDKAEQKAAEVDALKEELASLQRQNSHLQTRSHRQNSNVSASGSSESPPSDLVQQLESKSATIEAMELEISNLRAQLSSQSTSSSAHETQIAALEEKLSTSESNVEKANRELADTKQALTRASEKAVKEGVDKTSTETLIKNLERELEQTKHEKTESDKKTETLEKKLQALGNLHKESESRHQARLRESENTEKEANALRTKLASVENENLRFKEERENIKKRDAGGGADDDAIDELEDEGRQRLERRIRELEGENFDLRRGVWREKRQELQEGHQEGFDPADDPSSALSGTNASANANAFDDVDLVGGSPDHARRRSMAFRPPQQHSSFSTVLSSGLAAFTGSGNSNRSRSSSSHHQHHQHHQQQHHQQQQQGTRGSLELLSEENIDDDFDEEGFARARAEEEGRKRVEWAREIKSKLNDWKGWRLDLVDSRAGAEGAHVGMGEIFEV